MDELKEIASQIGISKSYLQTLYIHTDKFYKTYSIKKKSGKLRTIAAPNYEIKAIQSWLLRVHLEKISINSRAIGFVKNKNIKTNAQIHLNQKYILCLDIEDFFPSIKSDKIHSLLLDYFKSTTLANFFTRIVTFNDALPQGGVTSPTLSNIIFKSLDDEITSVCNPRNINYSRYADDLTFSSNYLNDLITLKPQIESILKTSGFSLNENKTRFMSGKNKKIVTGIYLNSHRPTVGRARKRMIRAALFNHKVKKDTNVNMNEINGLISFIGDIESGYFDKIKEYNNKLMLKKAFFDLK